MKRKGIVGKIDLKGIKTQLPLIDKEAYHVF